MDRASSRLTTAALTGGGRVLIGALSALMITPFALAWLGAARFGLWALAGGLIGLLRLADLGMGRALARRVAQARGAADADGAAVEAEAATATEAMATARSLALLLGLGGVALVAILRPVLSGARLGIPSDLAQEAGWVLVGTAVVAALEGCFAPGQAALEGLGRLDKVNLIDAVVQRLLSPWLVLPVLWLGGGLYGLVVKNAAAAILAGLWAQRALLRADPRLATARPAFSPAVAGELLRFGRHAQAVNLASALVDPAAKVLLGGAGGLSAVAAYELAARIVGQLGGACMAAAAGLFPAAAGLEGIAAGPERRRALLRLHARARRWTDRLVLPGWTLVAVMAPAFCRLWLGGEPAPAVARAVQILSPGWMLALIALPAFLITQAAGRTARSTAAGLSTAAVSLVGAYLARGWGLTGVATALSAGLATGGLWMLVAFVREQDLGVVDLLPDGRTILAAALGALLAAGLTAWGPAGWSGLLLAGAAGAVAALATLRLSGELADKEWATLGALAWRLVGRRGDAPMPAARPPGADGGHRMTSRTAIWAVIPAWNARQRLPEVLDALRGQVTGAVVVNNGSTDGTGDWLEGRERPDRAVLRKGRPPGEPPHAARSDASLLLRIIRNAGNRGWPTAINQGAQAAWDMGAAAILILNDDALVQPEAVAALSAALAEDPRTAAVTAHLGYVDRPGILNGTGGAVDRRRAFAALRGEGEADAGQYDEAPDPDYPSGAASLIGRTAWEAVGPFDEACYLYYEDVDWGLRARAAGWRIRYVPQARVLHQGSAATAGDPARRRYYNVRNRLRFARRWGDGAARRRCWRETIALAARQPLRLLFPSRRRDAAAVLWGIADHLWRRYGRSGRFG